jgi:hypothetical protein
MYSKNQRIKIMPLLLTLIIVSCTLFVEKNKVFAASTGTSDFVTRLYTLCQGRQPDAGGLGYWVNQLESGASTGAGVVESFIYSPEFVGKNLSNDQYLGVMYKAMFNRDPDAGGLTYWMNKLASGATRRYALANFVNSNEFSGVCSSYGITRGSIALYNNVDTYSDVTAFVQRFYLKCQGRMPDQDGLTYWVNTLVLKNSTAADLAVGFTNSPEFIAKNLSNADYVATLYRTFYDREPDSGGQAYWIKILEAGNSRRFVLAGFVGSLEFKGLCSSYGISSGNVSTTSDDSPFIEVEYNNTFATANYINVNTNSTANLQSSNDVDYFKFNLPVAGKVALNFKHDLVDSGVWDVRIVDINNNERQYFTSKNTDINGLGGNLRLPAGTYYVKVNVSSYYYNNTDYSFNVNYTAEGSSFEKEFNNSLTSANTISLNTSYTGNMQNNSDVDYYKFTLSSAGKVSLNFKHDLVNKCTWDVRIIDVNNNELQYFTSENTDINVLGDNLRLPAGNYYVKVNVYNSYYYNNTDYSFNVNYTAEGSSFEKEFNNSLTSANLINVNTNYSGNMQNSNDVDYYKFNLASDGKIAINFKHGLVNNGSWDVKIIDAGNNVHQYFTSGNTYINVLGDNLRLPAGNYYVKVNVYSYSGNYNNTDYIFNVNYTAEGSFFEKEYNDSLTSANTISLNTSYTGNMQNSNDVDYYKFTLSSAGKVTLNFQHPLVNDGSWQVRILDVNNKELQNSYWNSTNINSDASTLSLPAGTYYVKVTVSSGYSGYYNNIDYNFKVKFQ